MAAATRCTVASSGSRNAAGRSSSVSTWARGVTRVWPLNTGRASRKATMSPSSITICASIDPAAIAQKTQPFIRRLAAAQSLYGGVRALAGGRGVGLVHHDLAPEIADLVAALVVGPRLHGDDPAVGFARRLLLVEHLRLRIDGVTVERGRAVEQRLHLEVGDTRTAHVRHAHPEHEGVDEVADHDVLAELCLRLREPRVGVQWMVVHRDHAEQVVV